MSQSMAKKDANNMSSEILQEEDAKTQSDDGEKKQTPLEPEVVRRQSTVVIDILPRELYKKMDDSTPINSSN